ncbi:MAG: glycosyltransferase [Terracidiphilus sp.]|nr:glycosyltransferase [Terracidiphilus sp.]
MPPLVSVIIPSYNSAHYLADAVRSVFAQTYSALECIVIDDGSTDHTDDVLRELLAQYAGLKTARKANGGLSSARNAGLRLCSGSLVSFLDADDVLLSDKIERQVSFLNAHLEVDLVYGDYLVVTETLQPVAVFAAEMPRGLDPLDAFCYTNWFAPMVPLIRRAVTDKVGEFDEELPAAEDWDYWIRCVKIARVSYLAGPVAVYRQHDSQMSRDYSRMRRGCVQVATKNFREDRRRLRMAMAAIEFTHAKYLWKQRARCASLVTLMKFAFCNRFGLHMWSVLQQLRAITQSHVRPLASTRS